MIDLPLFQFSDGENRSESFMFKSLDLSFGFLILRPVFQVFRFRTEKGNPWGYSSVLPIDVIDPFLPVLVSLPDKALT
jgi:hypothetical protein